MTGPFGKGPKGGAATKAAPRNNKGAAVDDSPEPTTLSPKRADPFAQPSGGGSDYKFTDFMGELLLVKPTEEDIMPTKISAETEIVRVDVVRLDNDNERADDLLIFQSALLRTFRKVLRGPNNWTIGRLDMGEAKNGKSAPYIFVPVGEDEQKHGLAVATELGLDL